MNAENASGGDSQGTGTNTLEVTEGFDPNAARKAIIARHTALTRADLEMDHETVPGLGPLGYQQGETADSEAGDGSDTAIQSATPETQGEIGETVLQDENGMVDSTPQATESNSQDVEQVELKVFGKAVYMPKTEVDALGGVEVAQTIEAQKHRLAQADVLAREANRLYLEAKSRKREYEEKLQQLGRTAPNGTPAAKPNPAQAVQDPAMIEKILEGLWSGDPEQGQAAIREVLARQQAGPQTDPQQIAELVQAQLEAGRAEREALAAHDKQRVALNDLMREERFAPLMQDDSIKAMMRREFDAAKDDKRNQGRSWVAIGEEVGTRMLGLMGKPAGAEPVLADAQAEIAARTNFKKRIPQPSSASERAPSSQTEPTYPTSARDVVSMLRAARFQPVQ